MREYRLSELIAAIADCYSLREIDDLKFTPLCNLLYFVHPNHPVRSWDGKEMRVYPYTDGKLPIVEFDKPARL